MMRWVGFFIAIAFVGVAFGANSSERQRPRAVHPLDAGTEQRAGAEPDRGPHLVHGGASRSASAKSRWWTPQAREQDNGDTHVHSDPTNPGITLKPNLPNGTYTVTWRVFSAVDGHRTAGTFAFTVGPAPGRSPPTSATPPPPPLEDCPPRLAGWPSSTAGSPSPRWLR